MAKQSTLARRATVVALKAYTTKSSAEIAALTELSVPSVNRIYAEAVKRGFDLHRTMVDNQYVENKPRSGRPTKQDPSTVDIILLKVRLDRYGREKTCADLAGDLSKLRINISGTTIYRVLKNAGFRKTKPTRKPGLTKKMRAKHLAWCLAHESWTLEDWKNVIFSDETSVILLHRRGGYRIWRTKDERFLRSCIRERWKGASAFMFWGCFLMIRKDLITISFLRLRRKNVMLRRKSNV
jgi:transposase